jgi:hypothetical protein
MTTAMIRPRDRTRPTMLAFTAAFIALGLSASVALGLPASAKALTSAPARPTGAGASLSTGAIVIAALAALVALGCLAWAIARRRAFEPKWMLSLRHSMSEAGFHASATWAEFTDWVRLGR